MVHLWMAIATERGAELPRGLKCSINELSLLANLALVTDVRGPPILNVPNKSYLSEWPENSGHQIWGFS